jgi:hypothetical protein
MPVGLLLPASQFWRVCNGIPNDFANFAWLKPILMRVDLTSVGSSVIGGGEIPSNSLSSGVKVFRYSSSDK